MKSKLICRTVDAEKNSVVFCVYNGKTDKVEDMCEEDVKQMILSGELDNAKLENTVIKKTDSSQGVLYLEPEQRKTSSIFYVLDENISPFSGVVLFTVISNTGEKFEMSENVAVEFLEGKTLVNANISKDRLNVLDARNFETRLNRSLSHVYHDN